MHASEEHPAQLLITVEEAARRLCVARSHLYLYLKSGALPSVLIGRARRIAVADLEDFVDRLRVEAPASPHHQSADVFANEWTPASRRR